MPPLEAPDATCPSLSTHITPTVSIVQSSSSSSSLLRVDDWHVVPSGGLCDWTSTQSKPKKLVGVSEKGG